jgi:DNA-binding CsgD family transcriptional regulator
MFAFTGGAIYVIQTDPGFYTSLTHVLSLIFLSFVLLAVPFCLKWLRKLPPRLLLISPTVFVLLGTVLLFFGDYSYNLRGAAMLIGIILTGMGSGMMNLLWGIPYARMASEQAFGATAATILFTGIVYISFRSFPIALLIVAVLACPIISLLVLRQSGLDLREPRLYVFPQKPGLYKEPFLTALCFGIIVGVMRELIMLNPLVAIPYDTLRMITAMLVFIILGALALFLRGFTPGKAYRYSVFVIALGVAMALFFNNHVTFAYFIFLCGYHLFQIVVWTQAAHLASSRHISPFFTFGFGWGFLYLGLLAGKFIIVIIDAVFPITDNLLYIPVVGFLVIVIFVAYQFGLNRVDLFGEAEKPRQHRYYHRCRSVIEHFSLTERQGEVLFLLAQGKSAKMMQTKLSLAAGTINTHISHIYRRLNISSRDELIEMIDQWDDGGS